MPGRPSRLALLAIAALLGAAACSSSSSTAAAPQVSGHSPAHSGASSPGPARPGIVAVTSKGALVVVNSSTGTTSSTLVPSGVMGQEIAVSPDGSIVYFSAISGCTNEIESVPLSGGPPTAIAPGVLPAISPDGTKLAFAHEPWLAQGNCSASAPIDPADYSLAVRTLSSGSQAHYAMAASAPGLPYPDPVPVLGTG